MTIMRELRTAITISALAAAAAVQAQDLNQTIVGCVEVDCPAAADNVNDNCTVADTGSFPFIGLTRVPTSNTALAGLSWVKGFSIIDSSEGRNFHSSYYLGTPPALSLNSSTGGCAVFLHGAEGELHFGGQNDTTDTAQGTCASAMGNSCVDALVSRARSLVEGYTRDSNRPSISDACAQLQSDLEDSMDDACLPISRGSWSNFTGVALTGDGAPLAHSQDSSPCWPITPKEDELTLVSEYDIAGSQLVSDAEDAQWAITPILTVFYPEGDGSIVNGVDASMSCIKVMGPPLASLDTMSADDPNSGAAALSSSYSWASAALCVAIAASLALYAE
ncbi:hypothetical protein F4677DRAFT_411307 [Hypoxylon crocopeplum]|nr:hypothetical protein F4677DRAFT_411307 [Hypoxylon crocopeplum]